jgi:hypothetical protein
VGIIETLIAGQRRPEHEALRIAAAVKNSIPREVSGHDTETAQAVAAWGSHAEAVVEQVNAEIADEKRPRRAPAPPEHLEQFTDSDADPGSRLRIRRRTDRCGRHPPRRSTVSARRGRRSAHRSPFPRPQRSGTGHGCR